MFPTGKSVFAQWTGEIISIIRWQEFCQNYKNYNADFNNLPFHFSQTNFTMRR